MSGRRYTSEVIYNTRVEKQKRLPVRDERTQVEEKRVDDRELCEYKDCIHIDKE